MSIRFMALGDTVTLLGEAPEQQGGKPSKLAYLGENGVLIEGVQDILLKQDLTQTGLERLAHRAHEFLQVGAPLKRLSFAHLCWPLLSQPTSDGVDIGGSVYIDTDMGFPAVFECCVLQDLFDASELEVGLSYHPLLMWPSSKQPAVNERARLQSILWQLELDRRSALCALLDLHGVADVDLCVENEPTTNDRFATATHMGNRTIKEMLLNLPDGWGLTVDLQHLAMALHCLNNPAYPSMPESLAADDLLTYQAQFALLYEFRGSITFHVSQMEAPDRHVTPNLRWNDPIMPWTFILEMIRDLASHRDFYAIGDTWVVVEQDGGHIYPEGYQADFIAFQYLQEHLL